MRILLINTLFPSPKHPKIVGGAEVVAKRLSQALLARGHEVEVLRSHPTSETYPTEVDSGIEIFSEPMNRLYWPFSDYERGNLSKALWHFGDDIGNSKQFAEFFKNHRPDVIHTHNIGGFSTGVWRAASQLGIPIVHTLHDYYLVCPKTTRYKDGTLCAIQCGKCALLTRRRGLDTRLVGDVISVSGATLKAHTNWDLFANSRQHVIPNIVDLQNSLQRTAPLSQPITFGFIGRVTREKGIFDLASAFGRMSREAKLVVGGTVSEETRQELLKLCAPRAIEFLGFVRPNEFYGQIDALIVPSLWDDPFPTVILEAQASGLPVIGSRRGGIPEAIGSQAAGWIYDPTDQDALFSIMDELAADPKLPRQKGQVALASSKRFEAGIVARQHELVYAKAIEVALENRTGG